MWLIRYIIKNTWKIYRRIISVLRRIVFKSLVCSVGSGLRLYGWPQLYSPDLMVIGNNVTINHGVFIDARGGIKIGNDVRISPYAQIESGFLLKTGKPRIHSQKNIVIKNNVWLASGSKVLVGVTVGENSIVAAGAVVTKDVPDNSIAMGVPARFFPIESGE